METITLKKTFTYEDTLDNLTFWATTPRPDFTPYKPKLRRSVKKDIVDDAGETVTVNATEEYDNPQSVKEFCEAYIVSVVTNLLTTPIKKEVNRQVTLQAKSQADALAEQKAQEVISRLTIE